MYREWMGSAEHETMPSGRIRKPSHVLICQWVLAAWKLIPEDLGQKSFKKCCFTNDLDGTKDDAVWESEDDGSSEREPSESEDENE